MLARRRLIEAAAGLQAADRALLNLWIHRGLDDERLAGLTGMSAVTVRTRRERVLASLSEQLGASPDDVMAALRWADPDDEGRPEVTATNGGLATASPVSSTGLPPPPPAGAQPVTAPDKPGPEPQGELPPPPSEAGPPPVDAVSPPTTIASTDAGVTAGSSRHRGRIWAQGTVAIAIVVAVVLVVLLSGPSSHNAPDRAPPPPSTRATAPPAASTTPPTVTAAAPPSSTTATALQTTSTSLSAKDNLSGLPGGPKNLTGDVRLVGEAGHLTLRLTVKGLPLVHHGYYAAWLFNSVIDSRRLGRVTQNAVNSYPLRPGARRFRFVDISFQPRGTVNHSGASKLRAINPVDGAKTVIHKARARTPRRRRRASAVGTPQATTARRSAHRRTAAAHRRRGKRSRKASTAK